MDKKYDDIINLPHYEPKNHQRMTMDERSAIFAPFAALTGYEELVKETSRITDNKLLYLVNHGNGDQLVTFTYFSPDKQKNGGAYLEYSGIIKKIDNIYGYIILKDKFKIKIDDIINIQSEILDKID